MENFLQEMTNQELYGPESSSKKKCQIYGPRNALQSRQRIFVRVKNLNGSKQQLIVNLKSGVYCPGPRRTKYENGDISYGTCLTTQNGNICYYQMMKFSNGRYDYIESTLDKNQKNPLRFNFHESSLTWSQI